MNNFTWYVEPLDSDTNRVFSQHLNEENIVEIQINSRKVNLWQCGSYKDVKKFKDSQKQLNLKFTVYICEGNGKIREWNLQ